jgi:hypothetical protein
MDTHFKDRASMEAFLTTTISTLDDASLKVVITAMLGTVQKKAEATVEPRPSRAEELAATVKAPLSSDDDDDAPLSSDNDADIKKVMKEMRMDWYDAWTYIRCIELEEGASICCSEECEDHTSAIDELVESAKIGKKKRNARRLAAGRPVSDDNDTDDESNAQNRC